jgi:hypothetical protein
MNAPSSAPQILAGTIVTRAGGDAAARSGRSALARDKSAIDKWNGRRRPVF